MVKAFQTIDQKEDISLLSENPQFNCRVGRVQINLRYLSKIQKDAPCANKRHAGDLITPRRSIRSLF